VLLCVILICFSAIRNCARAADTPSCTPQMLDVQVLPLLEPQIVNELHGVIVEVANRSPSGCWLQGPFVDLLPQSGADTFTNSFFSNQEFSPSE
jgi:hypothetical protein